MRILLADKLSDDARTQLETAGHEVVSEPTLAGDTLTEALRSRDPHVLVVRSTKVQADHLAAASSLQLVVRAGAGVNTIDLDTASARGVFVSNCPGMNAAAVAELAFGHILNADRRIADQVADLRAGRWGKKTYSASHGVKGRTLGVIGCGSIGREMIQRAFGFVMPVVAWSPSLDDAKAGYLGVKRAESPVDVARQADILSVHVGLNDATRGMIDAEVLGALRPGAIVINTSRGEVVDEQALAEAVREKGVRAGLDVFCGEPGADGEWRTELSELEGIYGTHHVGASTAQAQEAVAAEACRIITTFDETGEIPNCVNLATQTPATHLMVVRHRDVVGVLAGMLDELRKADLNVQQMENVIFSGAEGAACARIQVENEPQESLLSRLRDNASIFDVQVVPL